MALVALGQRPRRCCLPDDVNVLEWDRKCDFLRHIYQGGENYYIINSEHFFML